MIAAGKTKSNVHMCIACVNCSVLPGTGTRTLCLQPAHDQNKLLQDDIQQSMHTMTPQSSLRMWQLYWLYTPCNNNK